MGNPNPDPLVPRSARSSYRLLHDRRGSRASPGSHSDLRVRYVVKATALATSHRPKKPLFNGDWWLRARHHRLRYDATNFSRSVSPESKNLSRLIPLRLRV